MGHKRKDSMPEARRWMGNLMAAWAFVTGLALAFASATYYRTGDIKIMIAYVGAPFIIGCVLFLSMGMMVLASRTERHTPLEPDGKRASKQRQGWYGPGQSPWKR